MRYTDSKSPPPYEILTPSYVEFYTAVVNINCWISEDGGELRKNLLLKSAYKVTKVQIYIRQYANLS